ncbi:hypothetical protein M513_11584 [Trichuris suis]|uniref:Peptidase A2 domain-containing protein n=1 Tax=Trichuris suis TaxID=68888 RepID=A0A085LRE4_9BILA|nr:hypothetical protein M513_11584 [Trichuris suis]
MVPYSPALRPPSPQLPRRLYLPTRHVGKRLRRPIVAAAIGNGYNSPLLFVRDVTGRRFLVDSGSEVSILPAQPPGPHRPLPGGPKLKAANGTTIDVFQTGRHEILDLGLGRTYPFKFVVAAVPNAILGADFLRQHGLIPDLKAARLRDGVTFLSATCSHCRRKAAARLVHLELEAGVDSVSIDRLKPAFLASGQPEATGPPISVETPETASDASRPQPCPVATRSGRMPRTPARFSDYLPFCQSQI